VALAARLFLARTVTGLAELKHEPFLAIALWEPGRPGRARCADSSSIRPSRRSAEGARCRAEAGAWGAPRPERGEPVRVGAVRWSGWRYRRYWAPAGGADAGKLPTGGRWPEAGGACLRRSQRRGVALGPPTEPHTFLKEPLSTTASPESSPLTTSPGLSTLPAGRQSPTEPPHRRRSGRHPFLRSVSDSEITLLAGRFNRPLDPCWV